MIPSEPLLSERISSARGEDGHPLAYRVFGPDGHEARATAVLFGGMMSHSVWFRPIARPLVAGGFRFVAVDRRGSGADPVGRGDVASAEVLLEDARAVLAAVREESRPLYLIGWCFGACLAVPIACDLGSALSGLVLATPGLFPSRAVLDRVARSFALASGGASSEAHVESPVAEEMFTDGPDLDRFIRVDPLRVRRFSPRFLEVAARLASAARLRLERVEAPILVLLAERDAATDNERTARAVRDLPHATVEVLPGSHGLQFDAPAEVAANILSWAART